MIGVEKKISRVRESAWKCIENCKTVTEQTFQPLPAPNSCAGTIGRLTTHLDETTRGVDALLNRELIHNSQILFRSCLEASYKLLFIALQKEDDREVFANELTTILAEIQNRRIMSRAETAEQVATGFSDPASARVFRHLASESEINASSLSRTERREIEQRWAFTSLHSWLVKRFDELGNPVPIETLILDYGMSSHLLHADGIGLGIQLDQATREPKEAELKILAESCKLYTNICLCWILSAYGVSTIRDNTTSSLQVPLNDIARVFELCEPFQLAFNRSQDAFYEKEGFKQA